MSKIMNFSELKRKNIRKELSDGVVVYNPTTEQRKQILEIIVKNTKEGELNIEPIDIFLDLIPMLTNVKMDLDKERDKNIINEILNDPDELLDDIVIEIKDILKKEVKRAIDIMDDLKELPKEKIDELINARNQEEKEIEELEKQLIEKKNKLNK